MASAKTHNRAIDVDGVQLYADSSGTAPALVFLHYWGGSRRTWEPVLTRLHPDQAVVAYDQRGWGDSANAPGLYDMKRLTEDEDRMPESQRPLHAARLIMARDSGRLGK